MVNKRFEDLDRHEKIEVISIMNCFGMSEDPTPPYFRISSIIKTLLRLEEGVEYDIKEVFSVKSDEDRLLEVLAYLDNIYTIKEFGWDTPIDFNDTEEDSKVKKIITRNVPHFDFNIDKDTLVVKRSPFYRSLNDAEKVLFYLQSHKEIPTDYHNVGLPERFRTNEFYKHAKEYFFMASNHYVSVTFHGHKRLLELLKKISDLSSGREFLEKKISQ